MTKKNFRVARYTLIISGFALYALSMFLPSLRTKVWEGFQTMTGVECLILGIINGLLLLLGGQVQVVILCILSNVLMGVSFICVLARKETFPLGFVMFLEAFVILMAFVFPKGFNLEGTTFLVGYYVWLASFILTAAGMMLEDQSVIKENVAAV